MSNIKEKFLEEWRAAWELMASNEKPNDNLLEAFLSSEREEFDGLKNSINALNDACSQPALNEEELKARGAILRNALKLANTLVKEKSPSQEEIDLLQNTVEFAIKAVSRKKISEADIGKFQETVPRIKDQCAGASSLKNKLWGGLLIGLSLVTAAITFSAALPLATAMMQMGRNLISPQKYSSHLSFHKKVEKHISDSRNEDEQLDKGNKLT